MRAFLAPYRLVAIGALLSATLAHAQQPAGRVFNPRVNPLFPGGDLLSYEQLDGDGRELQFLRVRSNQRLSARRERPTGSFSLPGAGAGERVSGYSGDLDWRPVQSRNVYWFSYIAGDERGLHLYLNSFDASGNLATTPPLEVPFAGGVRSPRWSPDGKHLAFISDSSVLHVIWNVDRALQTRSMAGVRATRIDAAGRPAFFPAWSPRDTVSGKLLLAYQVDKEIRGNRVFAIDVITLNPTTMAVDGAPVTVTEALSGASAYRPSWSADGTLLAFYSDRGRSTDVESQRLDIRVAEIQRSRNGNIFRGELLQGRSPRIAEGVLPVETRGPEWTQVDVGGKPQAAIVYVQRDDSRNNPIAVVGVTPWRSMRARNEVEVVFSDAWGTANHKEVNSAEGCRELRYAYVSVVAGGERVSTQDVPAPWARGTCAPIPDPRAPVVAGGDKEPEAVKLGPTRAPNVALSMLIPGAGQLSAGRKGKGSVMLLGGLAGGAIAFLGASGTKSAASDAESAVAQRDSSGWASLKSDFDSKKSLAMIGAGVAAAAWLASVADAALSRGGSNASRMTVSVGPAPAGSRSSARALSPEARVGWRFPLGGRQDR